MAAILEKLDHLERTMAGMKKDPSVAGSRLPSLTEETTAAIISETAQLVNLCLLLAFYCGCVFLLFRNLL
jgi:hypothetical protein